MTTPRPLDPSSVAELDYLPPTPSRPDIPIGVIGCGGITAAHLRAYREAGYRVVALCDVRKEAAEERRAEFYPDAAVFTDHRTLLAIDEVEVVDIATHTDVRHPIIEDALRAGKHVLSQKPFAEDLDAAARLCDLADSVGRLLAVNQNGRWSPAFAYLLSAKNAGVLGRIIAADFYAYWPHDQLVHGKRFATMDDLILLDFGIHWFDLLGQLFADSPARMVYASVASRPGQVIDVPTLAQVSVDFADAQATLLFRGSAPAQNYRGFHVAGTEGSLHQAGHPRGDTTVNLVANESTTSRPLTGTWFENGFRGTMSELLLAIDEGRKPANDARTVIHGLQLCFAAIASARSGQPIEPETIRKAD